MLRLTALVSSATLVLSSALVAVASAAPATAAPAAASTAAPTGVPASLARAKASKKDRFYRATTRPGDRDRSVTSIKHVRELQYRLRWAGVYGGAVNGTYTARTEKAVKKFQKRVGLKRTGVANTATWKRLIQKTVRGKSSIPKRCKSSGWHACYDRNRHQVVLYKNGTLWNSWLVRGGASSSKTRTGSFSVFFRSKSHVSSIYEAKMPYAQFFSGGQAFHASYLMMDPFVGHSHGCVNMYIPDAKQLWALTANKKLKVTVYGAWS
ncbi:MULTISPECIES: L,D-transpeptidase family protein [Mumia]|uniref:L,D-transpeptidase family protein n=1 Tax=Mumia TaxID=1546255 RepID=UPI00141E15C8|nr:L,D-transpeptidase family protein [Mumia sp. ZJ430]